jgi:hypothetical protein
MFEFQVGKKKVLHGPQLFLNHFLSKGESAQ